MIIIKEISERIGEELEDAEYYAKLAHRYKLDFPDAAKVFAELSGLEMEHQSKLHAVVTKLIERYRAEKGTPPPEMMAVYNYLHDKHVAHAAEVMALRQMYN